eukprot:15474811-Alexandrium_andersonii.AAC.1
MARNEEAWAPERHLAPSKALAAHPESKLQPPSPTANGPRPERPQSAAEVPRENVLGLAGADALAPGARRCRCIRPGTGRPRARGRGPLGQRPGARRCRRSRPGARGGHPGRGCARKRSWDLLLLAHPPEDWPHSARTAGGANSPWDRLGTSSWEVDRLEGPWDVPEPLAHRPGTSNSRARGRKDPRRLARTAGARPSRRHTRPGTGWARARGARPARKGPGTRCSRRRTCPGTGWGRARGGGTNGGVLGLAEAGGVPVLGPIGPERPAECAHGEVLGLVDAGALVRGLLHTRARGRWNAREVHGRAGAGVLALGHVDAG